MPRRKKKKKRKKKVVERGVVYAKLMPRIFYVELIGKNFFVVFVVGSDC